MTDYFLDNCILLVLLHVMTSKLQSYTPLVPQQFFINRKIVRGFQFSQIDIDREVPLKLDDAKISHFTVFADAISLRIKMHKPLVFQTILVLTGRLKLHGNTVEVWNCTASQEIAWFWTDIVTYQNLFITLHLESKSNSVC